MSEQDKQAALDWLKSWGVEIGLMAEDDPQHLQTIIRALTAPQPVADLEGLRRAVDRHFWALWNKDQDSGKKFSIYAGLNTSVIEEIIDHLHATGRLNTAQQAEEIKTLKAAVRDLADAVLHYSGNDYDGLTEKHAATIEAAKEG